MQKTLSTLALLFCGSALFAQEGSATQVSWTYTAKKVGANTYEVHCLARISGNWHIYAQNAGDGPVSTSFSFTRNPLVVLSGPVKELGKMKTVYESAFKSNVRYYEKTVDFVQTVRLKSNVHTSLAGKVEFMVCNEQECLPPADVNFTVPVGG